MFETRTAFDCVLRSKVSKFGDIMDNLGKCSHHIDNMKTNISSQGDLKVDAVKVLDRYLDEVNYMRKSFV